MKYYAENCGDFGHRGRIVLGNKQCIIHVVHKDNCGDIGMYVQFPMILEFDNKGIVDLVNNYSVRGRTRHVETRQYFLRKLKEEGSIKVI
jgi:hypothetical protein